jgi:hypothetical protein
MLIHNSNDPDNIRDCLSSGHLLYQSLTKSKYLASLLFGFFDMAGSAHLAQLSQPGVAVLGASSTDN